MYSPSHRSISSRKSSFSSRKPGSHRSSPMSHVIYRSLYNVVETFGPALPVLVREALTFSDKNATASVKVSDDGWAWFVCGRRLLVWPCFGEDQRRRTTANLCRELALPSSDLAYRADLVTIFSSPGSQVPSCLAVSPEGLVRYWPSIAHEGASIEVNADLHGQECDCLCDAGKLGIILATTTSSVVLLTPTSSCNRPGITVKPLRPPQGWLGGITRLIPSLIFGSQGSHGVETKLVKVLATERGSFNQLILLAGHSLHQWLVVNDQLHSLIYECHVTKIAIDAFHKTIWDVFGGNASDIQVWLLDAQPIEAGLCVLMAATNPQVSPEFFYALGNLIINEGEQTTKFDRFCPIKSNTVYQECAESELLSCRFLLHRSIAILYTRRKIIAVSALNFGEDVDNVDVVGAMDEVLGASLCRGVPVLFTKEHGLFTIVPVSGTGRSDLNASASDVALADSTNVSIQPDPFTMTLTDVDLEQMENSADPAEEIQAAFVYYLRKHFESAERICNGVGNSDEYGSQKAILTSALVDAVEKMANAPPVSDPRWSVVRQGPVLGSTSLQIATQIEDKMRAIDAFVTFLKWNKWWEKFRLELNSKVPVQFTILEFREKLIALSVFKQFSNNPNSMMDQCIRHVAEDTLPVPEGLTCMDVFFCKASQAHVTMQIISEWCEAAAHSDRRPLDTAATIGTANQIILQVLETITDWRCQNSVNYLGFSIDSPTIEFLPWTAAPGKMGLRDSLMTQHSLTLKYGVRATGEQPLRTKLLEQLLKLSDLILDGWRTHVRSVRGQVKHDALAQQYENVRQSLIKPFIADGEYERATMLAEKYLDMHSLIEICDITDNMERLDTYCSTFSDQNFSNYLFNWYIREGKSGHLLERFRSRAKPSQQDQLARYLEDHPTISWVQDILRQDLQSAHSTLLSVAADEKDLLQRKKTIASLSKLCILASNESEEVVEDAVGTLDADLNLIAFQEDVPMATLVAHGYDPHKMPVLTPAEIIQLYIWDQNENATEYHYKTALDILSWVSDDLERNQLKHSIWCSAILRDSWTDLESEASIEVVLNLTFFKLVDLLEVFDGMEELLPPINSLLESEELGELRHNRQFQYLLQLGYENFQKSSTA